MASAQDVSEYHVAFGMCRPPQCEKPLVVLRAFRQGAKPFVLAVDTEGLTTRILARDGLEFESLSWEQVRRETRATPYGQAIADSERTAVVGQDAGLVHTLPRSNGVVLTVDLCPSTRPLDRGLFTGLLLDFAPEEKPVPVSIAITGRWMLEHPGDLAWLRQAERDGELSVTWINHSFNHRYDRGAPLTRNFLLEPGTDAEFEVLATERAMIENGLRPSVFFRFPGLVSDPKLVGRVVGYGLIPVGSDAWLAKNQVPSSGSIVLVHGNGNEPSGSRSFSLSSNASSGPLARGTGSCPIFQTAFLERRDPVPGLLPECRRRTPRPPCLRRRACQASEPATATPARNRAPRVELAFGATPRS